jgi:hypothetical protein
MAEIMKMAEHAKKGDLMNTKKNYVYHFNKLNKFDRRAKTYKGE